MNTTIDEHLIFARAIVRAAIDGLNHHSEHGPHSDRLVSLLTALTHEVHHVIRLSDDAASSPANTRH